MSLPALTCGAATFTGSVAFSTPANISFGSGWQTWTPTITASGSMTVSSVTVQGAIYLRVGPIVYFTLEATFTLGGTASTTVYISPPITIDNTAGLTTTFIAYQYNGSTWSAAFGYCSSANVNFQVTPNGGGNWALGSAGVAINGQFRCA